MDVERTGRETAAAATEQSHRLASRLRPPGQGYRLEPVGVGAPGRADLECYVRDAFAAKHGAAVRSFMPTLLGFHDRGDILRGVAGVRSAGNGPLYLERYLDRRIEDALGAELAARGFAPARRVEIAEVGNLAGANCRAVVRMVAHIPAWLTAHRYTWIVFTATGALRQILAGFGAPLVELARADSRRVATQRDEWGRYYETDPRVYAGCLRDADGLAGFVRRGSGH
jgi:hypothetical protein